MLSKLHYRSTHSHNRIFRELIAQNLADIKLNVISADLIVIEVPSLLMSTTVLLVKA